MSFMSSMKLLTHRQHVTVNQNRTLDPPVNLELLRQQRRDNKGDTPSTVCTTNVQIPRRNLVNVFSYANRKLSPHIRATLNRNRSTIQ